MAGSRTKELTRREPARADRFSVDTKWRSLAEGEAPPERTERVPRGDESQLAGDPPGGRGWTSRVGRDGCVIRLSGDWLAREGATPGPVSITAVADAAAGGTISVDASELGKWDSALLVFMFSLRQAAAERGGTFDDSGLPSSARRLLALAANTAVQPPAKPPVELTARVGGHAIAAGVEVTAVATMVGETILSVGALPRGLVRMRGIDLLTCMYDAGASALPVVCVINILVGCILAFVGAVQLRRFGADVYVAALVGVGMVREMAALMTGIAVSGRTGGAYAAHISTMVGSEEIDALRAIGIPVFDYLILPRVLALTCMMPLLYLFGSAIGIFGGFLVSVAMLHTPAAAYIQQTQDSVALSQVGFGLMKSVAFGMLIAIAGCRTGLRAGRSAADVGHAATTAVVTGIIGVIALDAIFAVCANAFNF